MLNLNLISPTLKKEVRLRHINAVIKLYCLTLIAVSLLAAGYLFAGGAVLYFKNKEAAEKIGTVTASTKEYAEKIGYLNDQIKYIETIQSEYIPYSIFFDEIMNISDNNINFSEVSINSGEKNIAFKGHALTRDSLLLFKKNLENSKFFTEVNLPLTDILKKENINFTISCRFNYPL
jgi:hypothetical protein